MNDFDILANGHMAHLAAVQGILGPNMRLGRSSPQRIRGPRRRGTEPDRKLRQMQRRLRHLAMAAEMTGQADLSELADAILKDTEETE